MIGANVVYALAGAMFAGFAVLSWRAGRSGRGNAVMYALLALSLLAGDLLGNVANGCIALAIVALVGLKIAGPKMSAKPGDERAGDAVTPVPSRHLFVPALVIPVVTFVGGLILPRWPTLFDRNQATLLALTMGVLLALALALRWVHATPIVPLREGRRLMDRIGWAALMPQMLASLGAIFAAAGVGNAVGAVLGAVVPPNSLIGGVIAYGVGMALLTMAVGNAFAAFPVMMAAVGAPILIQHHGGPPAAVAAIGMLAGFCGTLLTPMAANYNLVPVALLGLGDRYAVIRAQAPTGVLLLLFNLALLYWVVAR